MFKTIQSCRRFILVAGLFALAGNAQTGAQAPSGTAAAPVEIKLERSKIVVRAGKEVIEAATSAKPGDVLLEVVTYTNNSKSTVRRLEATLPVPTNTELLAGSVTPNNAFASVDDKKFAAMPLKRKVRAANGTEVEQVVPLSAYRSLRWYPGELAAGKSLTFSARFKVSDDQPSADGKAR